MRRSAVALAILAVLAAVTACFLAVLADGAGKVQADSPVTITAHATGSLTPTQGTCNIINGDFLISPNVDTHCGDGVNEYTTWIFDFTTDPAYNDFKTCTTTKEVTSAVLTLHLTAIDAVSTDHVAMTEPYSGVPPVAILGFPTMNTKIQALLHGYHELMEDWRVDKSSAAILSVFNTHAGTIPMEYDDDSIVSYAKLELTCGATPRPVGGVVGLPALAGTSRGDAAVPTEGSGWPAGGYAALAGVGAVALMAVVAGGWYARRRLLR